MITCGVDIIIWGNEVKRQWLGRKGHCQNCGKEERLTAIVTSLPHDLIANLDKSRECRDRWLRLHEAWRGKFFLEKPEREVIPRYFTADCAALPRDYFPVLPGLSFRWTGGAHLAHEPKFRLNRVSSEPWAVSLGTALKDYQASPPLPCAAAR